MNEMFKLFMLFLVYASDSSPLPSPLDFPRFFFFIYIFRGERDWLCIAPMQINDRDYSISVKSLDDDIENV